MFRAAVLYRSCGTYIFKWMCAAGADTIQKMGDRISKSGISWFNIISEADQGEICWMFRQNIDWT